MFFGHRKESDEDIQTVTTSQELCFDTDDSLNRSDTFTFQFAASQWQKLVLNAEGLFSKLVQQGLSKDSKQQIEQWLFLKQEFDECLSNEASINKEKEYHSLERIDEVTESEEGGTTSEDYDIDDDESELSESGEISSFGSEDGEQQIVSPSIKRQDFHDKLVFLLEKFCEKTDVLILNSLGSIKNIKKFRYPISNSSVSLPLQSSPVSSFKNNQRRKSIISFGMNISDEHQFDLDNIKKETCLTSQSKRKFKKLLKQLKKEEEQNLEKEEKMCSKGKKRGSKDEKEMKLSKEEKDRKFSKEEKRNSLRNSDEDRRDLYLMEMRNSRQSLNEDGEDKLRDEITNLRKTRDFLVEQRKSLDTKLNRDKSYTKTEERKYIELDEAIEAIDATIEFKNGTICGRSTLESKEESEQVLIDRLMRLSNLEIRSLLCKYFKKTVDLREAGRKLEEQISELDQRLEAQQWKITALSSALQQAQLENERRLITVTKEHEEKLHLMFRHYTGSSSSAETEQHSSKALLGTGQQAIPQQNLKKLGGTLSGHTTKVTRVKNKLIIQQSSKKTSN